MNLKLKVYREGMNLTQKEFARAIKKSVGTIQSWERGDSFPNAEAIWDMCELFGTDPNDFLGWWEEHPRPADAHEPIGSDESALLRDYRVCTPDYRRMLLKSAAAFRDSSKASETASGSCDGEREAV